MAQKSLEEKEDSAEVRKIRIKQFNKFLSDYFNWIVIGVAAMVFIFGFFILLLPKYEQTVNFINSANQQQVLDTSSKQDELNKIKQLLAKYNNIDKKYIDKINAIAPLAQNKEELFSQLNYLISVNQLFLQSISLGPVGAYADQGLLSISPAQKKISDSLQTVNVTLSIRGTTYDSFKQLLSALENNLRLMDVLSVRFDPQGQSTQLTINTYYSKK